MIPLPVLEELLAASPADFVRTRRRLAVELRQKGEPFAAGELEAVKKPSAVVWAVNQLARRSPGQLAQAGASAGRLRNLQLGSASGDPAAVQAAAAEYRRHVAALVDEAIAALRAGGASASRAISDRIRATLHGAIVEEDAWHALRHGRLIAERPMAGFGAFAGAPTDRAPDRAPGPPASVTRLDAARRTGRRAGPTGPPPPRPVERDVEAERRAAAERARRVQAAREAEERLRTARARVRDLSGALERAQRELAEAEREAARLGGRGARPSHPRHDGRSDRA